ncbi:MAG: glycoside hydrolase family 3 N-terminal domain-containing protein [Bacteroidota bacterium]
MFVLRILVIVILSLLLILHSSFLNYASVSNFSIPDNDPPFLKADSLWVDSVFQTLTDDEKIAQLFMYPAYSNRSEEDYRYLENMIREYKIGGLIFMQGGPARQVELINRYQDASDVPLLVATDAEWGLSMRLDSTILYPRQMMLGAITDEDLLYEFGKLVASECKRVGVQVNFAPVIDVNNNPANPVIGSRSFGEDIRNVSRKGFYYMKGMQDNNVLAVGKHFPGHGDTDTDSHLSLPVIRHSRARIDSLELYPFRQLIEQGIGGIMVAHLNIPVLDSTLNRATTLSPAVVNKLLKEELGYKGLVFTDALNMGGISKYNSPGDVDVQALLAGNDILLFPANIPKAIEKIRLAVGDGKITQEEIDRRCKKVLMVKYWSGLNNFRPISTKKIYTDLNSQHSELMKRRLIEHAITLVKNDSIVPFYGLDSLKIATVAVGDNKGNPFQSSVNLYVEADQYSITKDISLTEQNALIKKLSEKYNVVIISYHRTNRKPSGNYGMGMESISFAEDLAEKTNVIIDIFGNPYILEYFDHPEVFRAILVSYNDWDLTQQISAQVLFGGIPARGKLPVSISGKFPVGTGVIFSESLRMKYSIPEEEGMDMGVLMKIDSVVNDAISARATPGCQVLVARNGVVVYHKAYGYHTYDNKKKVELTDIYDLASVTKVAASTISVMKMYGEGLCSLDSSIAVYLPELDTTDKKGITLEEIMTHRAGLTPWIPFYLRTVKTDSIFNLTYRKKPDSLYLVEVSKNLYIRSDYRDTIFRRITESNLRKNKDYKYSDIGYYWICKMTGQLTGMPLDEYVTKSFYSTLGAFTLCFNPLLHFPLGRIVPTEEDSYFRKAIVHGYVHDMGAAMLGGVCGHAGLFSDANDLAKLMQMLLQDGKYGGRTYLEKEVIDKFNTCPGCPKCRRGIGFDKPEMDYSKGGPTCQCVSANSYGHTGFTGTMAWVDPDEKIVYIFLSNRTYPDMNNNKLLDMDVRTKIQELIYQSIRVRKAQK